MVSLLPCTAAREVHKHKLLAWDTSVCGVDDLGLGALYIIAWCPGVGLAGTMREVHAKIGSLRTLTWPSWWARLCCCHIGNLHICSTDRIQEGRNLKKSPHGLGIVRYCFIGSFVVGFHVWPILEASLWLHTTMVPFWESSFDSCRHGHVFCGFSTLQSCEPPLVLQTGVLDWWKKVSLERPHQEESMNRYESSFGTQFGSLRSTLTVFLVRLTPKTGTHETVWSPLCGYMRSRH